MLLKNSGHSWSLFLKLGGEVDPKGQTTKIVKVGFTLAWTKVWVMRKM